MSVNERNEVKNKNVSDHERLFGMVVVEFSRIQWLDADKELCIPQNTADTWLRRMVKSGVIEKTEERGMYRKLSSYI